MLPGSWEQGAEAGAPWGDPLQLAEVPADRGPAPVPGLCPHCPRGLPTSLPPVPAWL